ncbi:MAG: MFS transporter [Ponticaulis sp.]|nr:MFS transporter [Ponticaulis sp.]
MSENTLQQALQMVTGEDDGRVCKDIPEDACRHQPKNFFTHIISLSMTKLADGLIDPKLVLSWLLATLSVPSALIGLLVPIRESGALLPQLFTAAGLRALPQRKWAWAIGSAVQGVSAIAIGFSALCLEGQLAGWAILSALTVLAIARSVCSVTYKDVLGKTVSKSKRGTATGLASSLSAGFVILFGILLISGIIEKMTLITFALFAAGVLWLVASGLFQTLEEEPGATEGGGNSISVFLDNFSLLKKDRQLQLFILVRGLLISTALAPPFMVSLASAGDGTEAAFGGLGYLVVASALASLLSSYVWGRLADRSSRKVLMLSGGAGAIALVLTVALQFLGLLSSGWALPLVIFGLMIAYQGVRLGRSTHLVDMADKDSRAAYTALSNTIIGGLLVLGAVFSLIDAVFGTVSVIVIMAVMAVLACVFARGLDEVQSDA